VIPSYKDLVVRKKAIALVFEIYRLTRSFPRDEQFGLTAQIRGAAVRSRPTSPRATAAVTGPTIADYCRSPEAR
jgi:hypothetical protein